MRIFIAIAMLFTAACSTQAPEPSLGDSPVHKIECPSFLAWEMCVARATKKYCDGGDSRLLRPSADELDRVHGEGQTASPQIGSGVPVDGRITRRPITIKCEA